MNKKKLELIGLLDWYFWVNRTFLPIQKLNRILFYSFYSKKNWLAQLKSDFALIAAIRPLIWLLHKSNFRVHLKHLFKKERVKKKRGWLEPISTTVISKAWSGSLDWLKYWSKGVCWYFCHLLMLIIMRFFSNILAFTLVPKLDYYQTEYYIILFLSILVLVRVLIQVLILVLIQVLILVLIAFKLFLFDIVCIIFSIIIKVYWIGVVSSNKL